MVRARHKPTVAVALRAALMLLALCTSAAVPRERQEDTWKVTETLVQRLGSEWYKIGVLNRELGSIRGVLTSMRNIELYPQSITGLSEQQIVAFDKSIEKAAKRADALGAQVEQLRAPLADALAIMREMVVGEPVDDMFIVIERGDLERIEKMLSVKHSIDTLWMEASGLLDKINKQMGLSPFATEESSGIEQEFFAIIRANLGQQSEEYHQKMARVSDQLAARADATQIRQMYGVELHQVKEDTRNERYALAGRKITAMKARYGKRTPHPEIDALLVRVNFLLGEYYDCLAATAPLSDEPEMALTRTLYTVQSWYALQDYPKIWEWASAFDFSMLEGAERNLLIWIAMEAGLSLERDYDYSILAGKMAKDSPYDRHVLHALARSYGVKGMWGTALQVLKSTLKMKVHDAVDREAEARIQLTIAQTYYELAAYGDALKAFFDLLKDEKNFEDALYGMAWCYTRMGSYQKAETTLRKLINQSPGSPRAAEAFLVMARRYVNKADYEWRKLTYLTQAEQHYRDALERLTVKAGDDTTSAAAVKLKKKASEITTALVAMRTEKRLDYDGLVLLYERAARICELVATHYETGGYHEVTFTEKREKILHGLDSLMAAAQGDLKGAVERSAAVQKQKSRIEVVKDIVRRSSVAGVEIQLARYRWEREYLDWLKTEEKAAYTRGTAACRGATDSAAVAACGEREKAYATRMDSLVARGDRLVARWQRRLTRLCLEELRSPLDPDDEVYLRYHMGELFYARENEDYARAFERFDRERAAYDEQIKLFHDGKVLEMPVEPAQPSLSHELSMAEFRRALECNPGSDLGGAIRYSLAWCYNDMGNFDSATAHMAAVATEYPSSQYAAQAWMYLGEYRFDHGQLAEAIDAYQSVMKYPETEWFDEALYKLAWSQYRLSNPQKAISSFLALVDLGEAEMKGKGLLEKESLDYIAISFSESDVTGEKGLRRAALFVQRFGDRDKGTQILHRLAGVFREQGRYDMAKKTYRTLLSMYPGSPKSPLVEGELLAVLERDLDMEDLNERKVSLFEKYNRQSDWAKAQKDPTAIALADSVASHQLYDASLSYHQIALQKNDSLLYTVASNSYEKFIRNYPKSKFANECHYNMAEILFSTGTYERAAEEYMAVSKRYPDSKYRETAAWNAIVASQNLLKQEGAGQ